MDNRVVSFDRVARFLLAAAAAVAAGCGILPSVGPDYSRPDFEIPAVDMPDAGYPTTNTTERGEYAPAASNEDARVEITAEKLVGWWGQFDDSLLTNLIDRAIAGNLTFRMAAERLQQSRWHLLGSTAASLPELSLGGSALKSENHRATASGAGVDRHGDYFKGGFDATWEIDIFGGVRRSVEAAWAGVEKSDCELADAWVSLTAEIASDYISLRTVQQRLAVSRANLKLQSQTHEILKSRFDSGIGDELAVNQSKYNVEQTRAGIPPLLAKEEALKNALAILVGEMPGALHEELEQLPERDWLVAPQKLSGVPYSMIRSRPDVRAAERALAAQVAKVGVAKSMLYPKVYLNGSLGLDSLKFEDFFHRRALAASIGPSFSWPLFQGGNMVANVRVEESKVREMLAGYELALERAFAEVRNAYSNYTLQYHRYLALESAVKAAQDAEAISQDLYKNGLADFNNVLDAQRSLLALEESLVVSRGDITLDLIALYKALGGGLASGE